MTQPQPRPSSPLITSVLLDCKDGVWTARTAALHTDATGATPSEAIRKLAEHDGLDTAIVAWREGQRERSAKDDLLMEQIVQTKQRAKKLRAMHRAAERAAPNVVQLRRR